MNNNLKMNIPQESGIYRIWIVDNNNQDISFIGVSKNINRSALNYGRETRHFLNNPIEIVKYLKQGLMPNNKSFPFKLALKLIENDLSLEDIDLEVLEFIDYENLEDVIEIRNNYIEEFNSNWTGFNGPNEKYLDYKKALRFENEKEINSSKISADLEEINIRKLIEENFENGQEPIEFIHYNLNYLNSEKIDINIYKRYCKKLLEERF